MCSRFLKKETWWVWFVSLWVVCKNSRNDSYEGSKIAVVQFLIWKKRLIIFA